MDHPIKSWLPIDSSFSGSSDLRRSQALERQSYPDEKCFGLARERTAVLEGGAFDQGALREIFARTYQSCIEGEAQGPFSR
jgi:hypothetical protein